MQALAICACAVAPFLPGPDLWRLYHLTSAKLRRCLPANLCEVLPEPCQKVALSLSKHQPSRLFDFLHPSQHPNDWAWACEHIEAMLPSVFFHSDEKLARHMAKLEWLMEIPSHCMKPWLAVQPGGTNVASVPRVLEYLIQGNHGSGLYDYVFAVASKLNDDTALALSVQRAAQRHPRSLGVEDALVLIFEDVDWNSGTMSEGQIKLWVVMAAAFWTTSRERLLPVAELAEHLVPLYEERHPAALAVLRTPAKRPLLQKVRELRSRQRQLKRPRGQFDS